MRSLWEKCFFLFSLWPGSVLLLLCKCSPLAGQEHGATLPGCGVCASAPAGEQRGRCLTGEPGHQVWLLFTSHSYADFWIFSKARWGKVPPLSRWYWWDWNPAGAAWGRTGRAEEQAKSCTLFICNLWLQIPLELGGESVPLYFWVKWVLIDLSSDYMLRWDTGMYSLIPIQHHSDAQAKLHTAQRRL